jgi:hypothetical protein
MKSILADKNGYGYFGLFNEISVKDSLKSSANMDGEFLDELGIKFEIGDTTTVKVPFARQPQIGHHLFYLRIYDITDNEYKCEFIERDEV